MQSEKKEKYNTKGLTRIKRKKKKVVKEFNIKKHLWEESKCMRECGRIGPKTTNKTANNRKKKCFKMTKKNSKKK